MTTGANVPPLLQSFFTDRLMAQRQASPHTIASYRDTFCLLLRFTHHILQVLTSWFGYVLKDERYELHT